RPEKIHEGNMENKGGSPAFSFPGGNYLTDSTSIFVELNPSYTLPDDPVEGSFYMEVVPGVSTAVNDTHFFAAGVHVPVTGFDASLIYLGGWYSIAFGGE
ncbi:hypothetical protein L6R53_30930, partial [Myxococcota bacterium]|nr:hypothetical protein [Myxococcota bacterium]